MLGSLKAVKSLILLAITYKVTYDIVWIKWNYQKNDFSRKNNSNLSCEEKIAMNIRRLPRRNFKYDFIAPSEYTKGPIISGWPPNVSRNINDYLPQKENIFIIKPLNLVSENVETLIIVKTRIDDLDKRNRIRRIWGKLLTILRPSFKVIFCVGKWNSTELIKEANEHDDIIQGNFVDSYHNLTLKTLSALKYATDTQWISKPEYVITMDDDVYLNVPLFLKVIDNYSRRCDGPYLVGRRGAYYIPLVDNKNSKYSSKWGVPPYMALEKVYPAYIHGLITIMSFHTAECIAQEAYNLPYFHIDDAFIYGFCPYRCGINSENLPGIHVANFAPKDFYPGDYMATMFHGSQIQIHHKVLIYHNLTQLIPLFKR